MNPEGTSISVCLTRSPLVTPFVSRPGALCSWFCHQYSRHPRGLRWTGVSCLVGRERFRYVSLDSFWTPSGDVNFWRRHRGTVCASFSLEDFRPALRVFQSSLRVLLSCLTAYLWVWFQLIIQSIIHVKPQLRCVLALYCFPRRLHPYYTLSAVFAFSGYGP